MKWMTQMEFQLVAEIGQAICLPDTKKYKMKICIGDFELTTDGPVEYKENYCRYSKRFEDITFKVPFKKTDNVSRVYVYLMDGSTPVCFWKGKVSDFLDPNPILKWYPLTCDLSVGEVTEAHKAGMF